MTLRRHRLPALLPAPAIVSLLAACGHPARAAPGAPVIRDSAGVRMVDSRNPAWRQGEGWSIDTAAAVPLASATAWGDEPNAVAALADQVAVAEDGGRIAWYDRRGSRAATTSIPGLAAPPMVLAAAGGGLVAWDADQRAVIRVDASRRAGAPRTTRGLPDGSATPAGAFADGPLLVAVRDARTFVVSALPRRDTVAVYRVTNGAAVRVLSVPGPEELTVGGANGAARLPAPFPRDAFVAVANGRVWVADATDGTVRGYDRAGRLTAILRAPVRGDPAAPAEAARWRARADRLAHAYLTGAQRTALRSLPLPATYAAFTALLASPGGELWARAGTAPGHPSRWNVFDANGGWLGEVRVAPAFDLVAIGDGQVVARATGPAAGGRLVILPIRR